MSIRLGPALLYCKVCRTVVDRFQTNEKLENALPAMKDHAALCEGHDGEAASYVLRLMPVEEAPEVPTEEITPVRSAPPKRVGH